MTNGVEIREMYTSGSASEVILLIFICNIPSAFQLRLHPCVITINNVIVRFNMLWCNSVLLQSQGNCTSKFQTRKLEIRHIPTFSLMQYYIIGDMASK
jgi:hypothetical protein